MHILIALNPYKEKESVLSQLNIKLKILIREFGAYKYVYICMWHLTFMIYVTSIDTFFYLFFQIYL